MSVHLQQVTFDAGDPAALSTFWSGVTGYALEWGNENAARLVGDGAAGPAFLFLRVPEGKTAKNRVHIDLGAPDLEAEEARVLGLGAELIGRYEEWGVTWSSFRDPEGNEFCIGRHEAPKH